MILEKQYYLDTFSVDEGLLRTLVAEGLNGGGDFCDLFFESSSFQDLLLRDGTVSSGGTHVDFGCGIRTLSGERTGYAYTESTAREQLIAAARASSTIAGNRVFIDGPSDSQAAKLIRDAKDRAAGYSPIEGNGSRLVRRFFKGTPNPAADRYPMVRDWREAPAEGFIPILESIDRRIKEADPRVVKVMASLSNSVNDILMFNSFEELKYDTRPMGSLSVSVVFQKGDRVENKSASRSFRAGAEMLSDALVDELVKEILSDVDTMFEAGRPKGGQMPVVMAAGASGILLHEAMGHSFEADFNRKGQSIFSGKLGTRICPEGINIVDDATIPQGRGSLNFDDEGVPGQKTYMVEDGILTSYLHDRISAKYYGVTPTGNGRRESFRYNPIPRMRATYMESGRGNVTCQDLIASVDKGIFVDKFANGQVKIGEGDFTFYVKRGFLIENGRLTQPVKDINIIGNGPQALSDIRAVASDLIIDPGTWTCGKGQSAPVSCGIPSVLIGNLTVGGE